MTNETETATAEFTQQEVKDFKRYYSSAMEGILASIPFGVTVDANQLSLVARNVATSMVTTQRDYLPEELREEEKSNFPSTTVTKEDVVYILNLLAKHDKGAAADVLTSFGVADTNKLNKDKYQAVYLSAYARLPAQTV